MPPRAKTTPRKKTQGRKTRESSVPIPIVLHDDWEIRKEGNDFDPFSDYGHNLVYFTIRLHHGGKFSDGKYVFGKVAHVDFCHQEEFNLHELSAIMVRLYSRETICAFYYVEPLKDLSSTLYELTENAHMKEFLKVLGGQRMIDVYVCHMTEADAKEKLIRDEEKMFAEFMKEEYGFVKADNLYIKKQSAVVIEEIGKERHFTAKHVTPKSWRQKTQSALQLICWKDSDDSIEDKEFLDFLELPFKKDKDTVVSANGDDESVVGGGAVEENVSEGDDGTVEENVNDSLIEAAVLQTFVEPPEAEKVRETSVQHAETSVTAPVTEEVSEGTNDPGEISVDATSIKSIAAVQNDSTRLKDDDAINIDAVNTGLDSDDVVDTDAVGSEDVAAVNPSDAARSKMLLFFQVTAENLRTNLHLMDMYLLHMWSLHL
ncbi:OLC1v1024082C1 [Oldenlandia corymbosa var. corymbosa]|uniref:OLC1v1024082C1 n=1 Tax=Oldenlandia corymbosa var. corymbosa TaxID=529605 RepID=A0AAV1C203_OLDCO|nr:OLC1v1024082C1 [Oldenlandia corymbosa var. corymbosa]